MEVPACSSAITSLVLPLWTAIVLRVVVLAVSTVVIASEVLESLLLLFSLFFRRTPAGLKAAPGLLPAWRDCASLAAEDVGGMMAASLLEKQS